MSGVGPSIPAGPPGRGPAALSVPAGLLAAVVLLTAACGLTRPQREEARALVETDATDAQVQIVTSTEFAVSGGSQDPTDPSGASVQFVSSDTAVQTLPFERTFDIRTTGRLFVRAQTPEAATDTPSVQVTIRVFVDGEQRNSVQGDLADQPIQTVFLSGN